MAPRHWLLFALNASLGLAALSAHADIPLRDDLALYGDARGGYFNLRREDRNGVTDTSDDWRGRLRAGLKWQPAQGWTLAARFAGRYGTDQDGHRFALNWHTGTPSGLTIGSATIDEAWAGYQGQGWSLKAGRFQTKHDLMGVARKSLDRNDSNNTEITWTDGVQWQRDLGSGWRTTLLAEYNDAAGPSNTRRPPLAFGDSRSRVSAFAALENFQPWGPVVQRSISVTWLPDALYPHGASGDASHYRTLVGRTALRWPLDSEGRAFLLAVEAGQAIDTPRQARLGLPGGGDSDGTAWQVTFNLMDLMPRHHLGLVGSRTGAGWLLSPDFTPNTDMVEVRYQWLIDSRQRFEARLRYREDIDKPVTAVSKRQDTDFYLRYTYSF